MNKVPAGERVKLVLYLQRMCLTVCVTPISAHAYGRVRILLGCRKNSKPEKRPDIAERTPSLVHAVLGGFLLFIA